MPLWKRTQHSFAAGQLDKSLMGRQDLDKYLKGATKLENMFVKRQGCVQKRRGTDLTADLDGLLGYKYDGTTKILPKNMRVIPVTNGDDGRYIVISNGVAFVASREGVMTDNLDHIREIPYYIAEDQYGNQKTIGGRDERKNAVTPVDVIHVIGAGNYDVKRFATLQEAFDAAVDGDTVRLHYDYLLDSACILRNEQFTISDGNGTVSLVSGSWQLKRGSTTYNAATSGRYVNTPSFNLATITATRMWTYSQTLANRTFTPEWNSTKWRFSVKDECSTEGEQTATELTYNLNGETVTATRASSSSSSWTYSNGKSYTAKFANGVWTITRTFYCNSSCTEKSPSTIEFTCDDVPVTVTIAWSFSESGWTADYTTSWRFSKTGYSTVTPTSGSTSLTQNEFSFTKYVTAIRAQKHITFDIYGYKLTMYTRTGYIRIYTKGCGITFDSTRKGAKVSSISNSNSYILYCQGSGTISSVSNYIDHVIFNGDIEWEMTGGVANTLFHFEHVDTIEINRGTFTDNSENSGSQSNFFSIKQFVDFTINDGTFKIGPNNKSTPYMFSMNAYLPSGLSQKGVFTVNGGHFILPSTVTNGWMFYQAYGSTPFYINGGKFECDPMKFVGERIYRRGQSFFETYATIIRGLFSFTQLPHAGGTKYDILEFTHDGTVKNGLYPGSDGFYGVKVDGETDYVYDGQMKDQLPYRISVPYRDEDLRDLCIKQSGDTVFIAHREYPPAKIYFDEYGYAYYEEIRFDNTEISPPVITSATMVGQDEKETDWPAGFDAQLKAQAQALGTVTDAGKNSNSTTGSDGSGTSATTYTATVVHKDRTAGRKTTTVLVKSVTSSTAIEREVRYIDGQPVGYDTRTISTSGSAQNNASASSVIVARSVSYVATCVLDGKESRPSQPVVIEYDMPWANNAVVNISVAKGDNANEPDYYNIYKDNGNGFGLIATTQTDKVVGYVSGSVETYDLFMPDNAEDNVTIKCVADYEEKRGMSVGSILRKLISRANDTFSTSVRSDICLVTTPSNADKGIKIDFSSQNGANFDRIKLMLDGRIYDKESDQTYLIYSAPIVTLATEYYKTDGTVGNLQSIQSHADCDTFYGGPYSAIVYTYKRMVAASRRTFAAPNGDNIIGLNFGGGNAAEVLNEMPRPVTFDLKAAIAAKSDFSRIKSIKLTFSHLYGYELFTARQGCIRSIHFYKGNTALDTGMVQDDYINPDMTVTPPPDTEEPHFDSADGYPGCVGIHEQRLVFASTNKDQSTIWMSRIADLFNFTPHDSIREDDAMELTIAATEFPRINHILMGRNLMLLAEGGEWEIAPVTGNALTYKTASCKLQSMIGTSRSVQPLQVNDEIIFVERNGCAVRTTNYDFTSESYKTKDLSVLCQSIFRNNAIVSMAYKQHPDSVIECVLSDGTLATLVYMPVQEVAAWSHHTLGGGWKAKEIVTPKCIVNGTTEMMLLVEKDGAYQLWKVRDDDDAPTAAAQAVMDGAHVGTLLDNSGDTVSVPLGNGRFLTGHRIDAEMVTVRPEPDQGATAQFEIKNATECEVRVIDASTFSLKPFAIDEGWREEVLQVTPAADGAVELVDKDVKKLMTGTNNRDGRIHLKHSAPWPITVLSISTTYQIEYENTPSGSQEGQQ